MNAAGGAWACASQPLLTRTGQSGCTGIDRLWQIPRPDGAALPGDSDRAESPPGVSSAGRSALPRASASAAALLPKTAPMEAASETLCSVNEAAAQRVVVDHL